MRSQRCAACLADDRAVALLAALHIQSRIGSLIAAATLLVEIATRAGDGAKQGDA